MSITPSILVFDSGAGGLSVCREIRKANPTVRQTYLADNAAFPYGNKPATELQSHIKAVLSRYLPELKPSMVVVACNTASTLMLDDLRNTFPQTFVGVVPAIKPAAVASRTKVVGMLATPTTVNSQYTLNLIQRFAPQQHVILCGSHQLVELAEQSLLTQSINDTLLLTELDRLFEQELGDEIDTVVLACTHFPIIKHHMHRLMLKQKRNINWVDSSAAIARRVNYLLGEQKPIDQANCTQLLLTRDDKQMALSYQAYLNS